MGTMDVKFSSHPIQVKTLLRLQDEDHADVGHQSAHLHGQTVEGSRISRSLEKTIAKVHRPLQSAVRDARNVTVTTNADGMTNTVSLYRFTLAPKGCIHETYTIARQRSSTDEATPQVKKSPLTQA